MSKCDHCNDPAVRKLTIGIGDAKQMRLCYLHAADEGLLDVPIHDVQLISKGTGYPPNGVLFVLEALVREESYVSPQGVGVAVIESARELFGKSHKDPLRAWRILDLSDIGTIFFALVDGGLLPANEVDRKGFGAPVR